jgi:hypothetical protein
VDNGNSWVQWTQFSITTLAVFVGAFITGSYQYVQERLRRPKLELDYAGAEGKNRIETAYMAAGGTEFLGIHIRVRLRNQGRNAAKNCKIFLTGIEEVQQSGVTNAPFYDSAPLSWAGWDFAPRDIPPGVEFYCDVFKISKSQAGWLLGVEKVLSSQKSLMGYRGTYRFRLLATADNAEPIKYAIEASYNGDWNNLRVVAVGQRKDS